MSQLPPPPGCILVQGKHLKDPLPTEGYARKWNPDQWIIGWDMFVRPELAECLDPEAFYAIPQNSLLDSLDSIIAIADGTQITPEAKALLEAARLVLTGESTLQQAIDRLTDPYQSEDYQRFVAQVAETCEADGRVCDSCLAGGICDGPGDEHEEVYDIRDEHDDVFCAEVELR